MTAGRRRAHSHKGPAICSYADVILLLTDWPEFGELDPEELGATTGRGGAAALSGLEQVLFCGETQPGRAGAQRHENCA